MPIVQLQNKFKELNNGFKGWLKSQVALVDVDVTTATSEILGGATKALVGTLTHLVDPMYQSRSQKATAQFF